MNKRVVQSRLSADEVVRCIIRDIHPYDFSPDVISDYVDFDNSPQDYHDLLLYIYRKVFTYYNMAYRFNYPSAVVGHYMFYKDHVSTSFNEQDQLESEYAASSMMKHILRQMGCVPGDRHTEQVKELLSTPYLLEISPTGREYPVTSRGNL